MKLYLLRGFETYTYTTHTIFVATSLEQAEKLCEGAYDFFVHRYVRCREIEDILLREDREFRESKEAELKRLREAEKSILDSLKVTFMSLEGKKDKSWIDLRTQIQELNAKHYSQTTAGKRFDEEKNKVFVYNTRPLDLEGVSLIMSGIGVPFNSEDKEAVVDYWMEKLHIIESDTLHYDAVTDGD